MGGFHRFNKAIVKQPRPKYVRGAGDPTVKPIGKNPTISPGISSHGIVLHLA